MRRLRFAQPAPAANDGPRGTLRETGGDAVFALTTSFEIEAVMPLSSPIAGDGPLPDPLDESRLDHVTYRGVRRITRRVDDYGHEPFYDGEWTVRVGDAQTPVVWRHTLYASQLPGDDMDFARAALSDQFDRIGRQILARQVGAEHQRQLDGRGAWGTGTLERIQHARDTMQAARNSLFRRTMERPSTDSHFQQFLREDAGQRLREAADNQLLDMLSASTTERSNDDFVDAHRLYFGAFDHAA
jgi:hypothetical protein